MLSEIKAMLPNLSQAELELLSSHILEVLAPISYNEDEPHSTIICPNCGSADCVKNGKINNKQRLLCRDCGRTFGFNAESSMLWSKLPRSTWEKYIGCMINGHSIRKSAEIAEVTVKTSFFMRHKLLDAVRKHMEKSSVDGIVEMDETFLPESFKGNHTKSFFVLPRKARKRGKQVNKRGISKEQICIATAIDRSGNVIMSMACKSRITFNCLNEIYNNHISAGSIICTDSLFAYRTLSAELGLVHKAIASGRHSNGIYNLSRINSLHSRFKGWMQRFNGVSTKFLPNYLGWFNWLEQNKDIRHKVDKMLSNALSEKVDVRINELRNRVAVFVG